MHRFKRQDWLPAQEAFYQSARAAGYPDCPDHNHPDTWGVGPTPLNNPDGIRISTAVGYLGQARHRLNLTIRPHCLARRLVFRGRRAIGVEVESGGQRFVARGREIILSAGAIGSPHLLLLSGVGPARHLESRGIPVVADLPGVGQNLRDHPGLRVIWSVRDGVELDSAKPWSQLLLRYTAAGSDSRNDMQISMQSYAAERPNFSEDRGGDRGGGMAPLGISMTAGIYLAAGAGQLRLASANPIDQPVLDFHFLEEESDRRRLREAVRICVELGRHGAFRDIIKERLTPTDADLVSDAALDKWLLREVVTSQHSSCTCKMGPSADPMAVVDQYGRVHGLESLRVADASIMPDCIRANINATVLAIGERVADFIVQSPRRGIGRRSPRTGRTGQLVQSGNGWGHPVLAGRAG